jgi:hypothetical protein
MPMAGRYRTDRAYDPDAIARDEARAANEAR